MSPTTHEIKGECVRMVQVQYFNSIKQFMVSEFPSRDVYYAWLDSQKNTRIMRVVTL